MEDVSAVCRQFKLLREKCHLNIEYSLIECYKHLMEKVIVYLNHSDNKNIEVKTKRKKFEDIAEDSLLKNFGWYLIKQMQSGLSTTMLLSLF